jgi:hypothetical protein
MRQSTTDLNRTAGPFGSMALSPEPPSCSSSQLRLLTMLKGLLFLSVLLALPLSANATTYYVDNCVIAGNDSNSGTSTATPWLTVAHVNAHSFNPGDSILFESTCTWNESLIPLSSGSAGNMITFGAYGSGARPLIQGPLSMGGNTANIANLSYLRIQGLHLGATEYDTIYMNNTSFVIISGNEINGGGNSNLFIGMGSNNITVTGNKIHDPGTLVDRGNVGIGEGGPAVHDILVQNNDIYGGDGAQVVCSAPDNAPYNVTIQYNLIHDATSTGWADGILLVVGTCVASYNVIWNNPHAGIAIEPGLCTNCSTTAVIGTLYGNTIYNNGIGLYYSEENASAIVNAENNILFDNNGTYSSCCSGGVEMFKFSPGGTWKSDYNIILHPTNASRTFYWTQPPESVGGGTYYSTLAAWQAASGNDVHSIQSDPLLVNPRGGSFTLQANSPAINAGVNLGSSYQFALSPVSVWPSSVATANQNNFGSAWEIGAFVYAPQNRPAPPPSLSITVH